MPFAQQRRPLRPRPINGAICHFASNDTGCTRKRCKGQKDKVRIVMLDEQDIENTLLCHRNMLFRIAYSYTGSKEDAEDVFQETCIALFRKRTPFRDNEHLKAWLIRVTINACRNLARSKKNRPETPLDTSLDHKWGAVDSSEDSLALEDAVWKSVATLKEGLRIVVILYYAEEFTTEEIAKLLRIKESSVRSRLTRARCSLRPLLEEALQTNRGGEVNETE